MGQALYRKYRSKSLDEIVGQEHITDTLAQAIKSGRLSHAYLLTGPRGVGKTSIARILAHEINGLPYEHEDNHIDIIEIDAASNRGIDEIRDLREKVYMAPVAAKYKVYIIDEVHMLTTQAFNALLKTLEEPPEHAIFILATTEAHKLPETIISRTQRHIFKPVAADKVIAHLKDIAKSEKLHVDDDALALFAAHGGGSFRDSISLLDQAGNSGKKVTRADAEAMLGIPPEQSITELVQAIAANQPAEALRLVETLHAGGYHPAAVAKQLGAHLRETFIAQQYVFPAEVQLRCMRELLDVAPAHDPAKVLELTVLRAMTPGGTTVQPPQTVVAPPATPEKPVRPRTVAHSLPAKEIVAARSEPTPEPAPEPITEPTAGNSDAILDASVWPQILDALKSKYNTLYGVMRMAVPEFTPGTLTLRFRFAFHQKRMNEAKHRKIVGDTIKELTGESVGIECLYDKDAQLTDSPIGSNNPSTPADTASVPPESLATISNIFGGGELIES